MLLSLKILDSGVRIFVWQSETSLGQVTLKQKQQQQQIKAHRKLVLPGLSSLQCNGYKKKSGTGCRVESLSFLTIQMLKILVECLQEITSSYKLYWCYSIPKKNVYPSAKCAKWYRYMCTYQEGNQLSMEVNNTATKTATLKLKKNSLLMPNVTSQHQQVTVPLKYTPFKFLKCFSMSLGKRAKKSGGLIFSICLLTSLTCNLFSVCQTIFLENNRYK